MFHVFPTRESLLLTAEGSCCFPTHFSSFISESYKTVVCKMTYKTLKEVEPAILLCQPALFLVICCNPLDARLFQHIPGILMEQPL